MAIFILLLECVGCRTPTPAHPSDARIFSDNEIYSRSWTNALGGRIQYLSSTTMRSTQNDEFLLARFGDVDRKQAYYWELYLVRPVPATRYIDTGQTDLPERTKPAHNINYLLARAGSPNFIIGDANLATEHRHVVFYIDEKANHQFSIKYDETDPLHPRRIASTWNGGVLRKIILDRNYDVRWDVRLYGGD